VAVNRTDEVQSLKIRVAQHEALIAKQSSQIKALKAASVTGTVALLEAGKIAQQSTEIQALRLQMLDKDRKLEYFRQRLGELADLQDWKRSARASNMPLNTSCIRRASLFISGLS
jgi:hypothetical protein